MMLADNQRLLKRSDYAAPFLFRANREFLNTGAGKPFVITYYPDDVCHLDVQVSDVTFLQPPRTRISTTHIGDRVIRNIFIEVDGDLIVVD